MKPRPILHLLLGGAVLLAMAACGELEMEGGSLPAAGMNPPRPAPVTVAGDWSGTIESPRLGAGAIYLTLVQKGIGVQGEYVSSFSTGSLNGIVDPSGGVLVIRPDFSGDCPVVFTFRLDGYTAAGKTDPICSLENSGAFVIARN